MPLLLFSILAASLLAALVGCSDGADTHKGYNSESGDLGAFILALGVGLVFAARDPVQLRALVGVAAVGSILHGLNHLYDDWLGGNWMPAHLLAETLPLVALAVMLVIVWRRLESPAR